MNARILQVARGELGVAEVPLGSNRGPRVNEYKAETWLDPRQGWPWCVAFVLWVWHRASAKKFPYPTASVDQLAAYARQQGLATTRPEPGDAACLGGDHITFLERLLPDGRTFVGLGGNQSNRVQRSTYDLSRVTTWISADKVAHLLGLPDEEQPRPKPPLYEVVRGEGQKKVVYRGRNVTKAKAVAARLIDEGRKRVTVRSKP